MISFNYETQFVLSHEPKWSAWISKAIDAEECREGEINYIFCSDHYLLQLNIDFLNHDTLTDIISFDYSIGKELHGDIYISIDRVRENAAIFKVPFEEELARVCIHGVLHYCGFRDKEVVDKEIMRAKEDFYLSKKEF